MMARSVNDSTERSSRPRKLRCAREPMRSRSAATSSGELAALAGCVASPDENVHTRRARSSSANRSAKSRAAGSQCAV